MSPAETNCQIAQERHENLPAATSVDMGHRTNAHSRSNSGTSMRASTADKVVVQVDDRMPLLAENPTPSSSAVIFTDRANYGTQGLPRPQMLHQAASYSGRPPAIYLLLFHTFCYAVGIGLVLAPRMELFLQAICEEDQGPSSLATGGSNDTLNAALFRTADDCRTSIPAQQTLAHINLSLAVTTGLLSLLTIPLWGALSDRRGRRLSLLLNVLSFILSDAVYIIVFAHPGRVSYRLIVVAAAVEGLFGGMGASQALSSAYIGDSVPSGPRAVIFSLMTALLFGGIAVGPVLSALLIDVTANILAPFLACLVMHSVQALLLGAFLPESLPKERQIETRKQQNDRTNGLMNITRALMLLAPRRSAESGRLEWSLFLVTLAAALYSSGTAMTTIQIQYAQIKFGWNAVALGKLLSLMGTARIVAMLLIIPWATRAIRQAGRSVRRMSSTAVCEDTRSKAVDPATAGANRRSRDSNPVADLITGRTSIAIEAGAFGALTLARKPVYFVPAVMIQALGTAAGPSLSSLGLEFATHSDRGRLTSSIGTITTLFGQVLAPIVFNSLYSATVETLPEATFILGASLYGVAFAALMFVRRAHLGRNG